MPAKYWRNTTGAVQNFDSDMWADDPGGPIVPGNRITAFDYAVFEAGTDGCMVDVDVSCIGIEINAGFNGDVDAETQNKQLKLNGLFWNDDANANVLCAETNPMILNVAQMRGKMSFASVDPNQNILMVDNVQITGSLRAQGGRSIDIQNHTLEVHRLYMETTSFEIRNGTLILDAISTEQPGPGYQAGSFKDLTLIANYPQFTYALQYENVDASGGDAIDATVPQNENVNGDTAADGSSVANPNVFFSPRTTIKS